MFNDRVGRATGQRQRRGATERVVLELNIRAACDRDATEHRRLAQAEAIGVRRRHRAGENPALNHHVIDRHAHRAGDGHAGQNRDEHARVIGTDVEAAHVAGDKDDVTRVEIVSIQDGLHVSARRHREPVRDRERVAAHFNLRTARGLIVPGDERLAGVVEREVERAQHAARDAHAVIACVAREILDEVRAARVPLAHIDRDLGSHAAVRRVVRPCEPQIRAVGRETRLGRGTASCRNAAARHADDLPRARHILHRVDFRETARLILPRHHDCSTGMDHRRRGTQPSRRTDSTAAGRTRHRRERRARNRFLQENLTAASARLRPGRNDRSAAIG